MLAQNLREIGNLHSYVAITMGLNLGAVERLKTLWTELPKNLLTFFAESTKISLGLNNNKHLRNLEGNFLKEPDTPYLPYIAVTLKDLTAIEESDSMKDTDCVNWEKMTLLHTTIDHLRTAQLRNFAFEEVPEIQTYLLSVPIVVDPKTLSTLSYNAEGGTGFTLKRTSPREINDKNRRNSLGLNFGFSFNFGSKKDTPPKTKKKNTIKLLFVGDCKVGKTSIVNSYLKKPVNLDKYNHTEALDTFEIQETIEGKLYDVLFFDSGGDLSLSSLRRGMYSDASAIFFCYSVSDAASLRSLHTNWHAEAADLLPKEAIKVLLGCKSDQETQISPEELGPFGFEFKDTCTATNSSSLSRVLKQIYAALP